MRDLLQPWHLVLIILVAILFFGPKKLPEIGKGIAEGIRGFKDALKDTPPDQPGPPKA